MRSLMGFLLVDKENRIDIITGTESLYRVKDFINIYSAPVSKFRYFGKYILQLYGYFYVHVSGQRRTGLEG